MSTTTIGPEQARDARGEKQIPLPQTGLGMTNLGTGLGMTSLGLGARVPTEGVGMHKAQMTNLGRRPGFFRTAWRLLRQLFHEATGALFAAMSLACANSSVRAWRAGESRWIVWLPVGYAVMMGYFAVTQFLRARKIV